jgi:hypothetical protein
MKISTISTAIAASLALMFALTGHAAAQGWANIKGQAVWAGDPPAAAQIKVDKDQAHCLSKGAIVSDVLVVDPKTKGVKNVMVWLAPLKAGDKLPIHPSLKALPKDKVEIDQPCCMFVPRITMMREGQTLVIKNPAPVLHNAKVMGKANGTFNLTIPAGQQLVREGDQALKAETRPMLLGCDVHGWMGGRIGVFDHPYFTLTKDDGTFEIKNAPAGKYKIFLQHEKTGWVHKGSTSAGQEIEIKPGGTLDLGKYEMKDN